MGITVNVSVLTEYERTQLGTRQPLPERYLGLAPEVLEVRIRDTRTALGARVVLLGHHYQRDEVIRFADHTGDSWKLARLVGEHPSAESIIFCGVHFMAESADILAAPHQQVILPDLAAGCSMSDMAAPDQLAMCWRELSTVDLDAGMVPVTYINSAASIKAFCGEHGGIVCTSSNARGTLEWAWARGERVLFLPDQHLGRNTAFRMGIPLDRMAVWDPEEPMGGLTREEIANARILLWKGHCSVHTRFTVRQIEQVRAEHPGIRVIVHPECPWEVVEAADASGSTETILRTVRESEPGSVWAVGTEIHLVNRLAREVAPDRTVMTLDPFGCLCSTMFRVSPNHLLWVLEGLLDGEVHNRIIVEEPQKSWARVALDRMLQVS
jgi:quinolinate synthase